MTTIQRELMFTFVELIEKVKCLPSDLSILYREAVQELGMNLGPGGLAKSRKTLMWISAASELKPFTLEELWDALAVPTENLSGVRDLASDPIVQNRIPIRSWEEFGRVLHGTCGLFIDIVHSTKGGEVEESCVSPTSVIQLMHQTVKDFLEDEEAAGPLHFTRKEAASMVESVTLTYGIIALPVLRSAYAPFPTSEWSPSVWELTVAKIALYLEDKKLLPFFVLLLTERRQLLGPLKPHFGILNNAFMLMNSAEQNWIANLQTEIYDVGQPVGSAIIGRLFHIGTTKGLTCAVNNLLHISSLIDSWWESYEHTVLNGVLFTVLDCSLRKFRDLLIHGDRSLSSNRFNRAEMAIDTLYRLNRSVIPAAIAFPAEISDTSNEDICNAIGLVLKHWESRNRSTTPTQARKASMVTTFATPLAM
jgi:hypothetical protein